MSGDGAPEIITDGTGLKGAIVAGRWHETITDRLLAGARRVLAASERG
jgi:6,7-dimethyl-8-ribityllumazine synthase